jgi:hypothetical protein
MRAFLILATWITLGMATTEEPIVNTTTAASESPVLPVVASSAGPQILGLTVLVACILLAGLVVVAYFNSVLPRHTGRYYKPVVEIPVASDA